MIVKNFNKARYLLILSLFFIPYRGYTQQFNKHNTFCNPLNLSYRFQLKEPSRREGADPTVVLFQDSYYLFASKSGGYWKSENLIDWDFITSGDLPWEDYAPTALNLGDTAMLFMASSYDYGGKIYYSKMPEKGNWKLIKEYENFIFDPALFLDDDNRLFLYWGCTNRRPIYAIELDVETLEMIGEPVACLQGNQEEHGWEEKPAKGFKGRAPSIEGAWMNKHNGKYYLQYAGPGTQFPEYGDGVYVADKPLGPFKYANYSPFSSKLSGFANGAGHGSTFRDKNGHLWHIATNMVSVKHKFERRISLYPAGFDEHGYLYCNTSRGDYPQFNAVQIQTHPYSASTNWKILSTFKTASASSSLTDFPVENAFDENIQTWWAAKTNEPGEWLQVDLGKEFEIQAVQVNFAEHSTHYYGRETGIFHQYLVEYSKDGRKWKKMIDKSKNNKDVPHDYTQLKEPVNTRYLKITNMHIPDENFAIRDFRVFGTGNYEKPAVPVFTQWDRNPTNQRFFQLRWSKVENATGYQIEYGIAPDKLYTHILVYQNEDFSASYLNKGVDYFFTIRSFNENGVSEPGDILEMPASGAYNGWKPPWMK